MDLTVQILTKNNQNEIAQTLQSLQNLNCQIIVNDLGSQDKTTEIAAFYNARILHNQSDNRSQIRNLIVEQSGTKWQMYMEPGEILIQGVKNILNNQKSCVYLSIITKTVLKKEIRLWNSEKKIKFKDPVFEYLDCRSDDEVNACISGYLNNTSDYLPQIKAWQEKEPLNPVPYYYETFILLEQGDIDNFMHVSQHYMFLEKNKKSMSSIMNRYYFALCCLHKKQVRPTLQNVNICLCAKPLMAEFWCLIGDVYYYLIKDFKKAKSLYQNALILGSRRAKKDKWPMDISKYKEYPQKMIESCEKIVQTTDVYAVTRKA